MYISKRVIKKKLSFPAAEQDGLFLGSVTTERKTTTTRTEKKTNA